MKCPICGAENPEGQKFCGDCGSRMPDTVPQVPVSAVEAHDVRGMSFNRKKVAIAAIVVVVVLIVIAASLAYYYQPVRGTGFASSTTVVLGQSIRFDFNTTQGVGPFSYLWSFGDGTTSHAKNPTHTYDASGTWTVTVTVTDIAGMKCSWGTEVTVRLPLVFIDDVSYPSTFSNPSGDSYYNLYVDGILKISHSSTIGATLEPGTNPELHIWFYWYAGNGYYLYHGDFVGHLDVPTTQIDLHCVLHCDHKADPKFWLVPV